MPLKAQDEHRVQTLRKYLHSGDNDLIKKAVFLAGTYRVAEVVPDLIGILRKKAVTGTDLEEKIPLVQALGQIGDTRANDVLSNILQTKSLFFRSALEKLKAETANALKNLSLKETREPAEKVLGAGH
jgi:HEAT repeat protein